MSTRQAVIESGRAEYALNVVKTITDTKNDKTQKEYKSYARKLPTLVLTNGLAATVAFVLEKGKPDNGVAYRLLSDDIKKWLVRVGYLTATVDLEEYVCSLDSIKYRIVTNEVLALLVWLKRFAGGLIEGDDE